MKKTFRNLFMFVVFAYLYIPIIILVVNSFNADRYGFSWNWYERLFNNDTLVQATLNSVTIAFFAATLSTILGALTSIALYRYKFRGKQMVGGLLFIVMMSPDIVMAVRHSTWLYLIIDRTHYLLFALCGDYHLSPLERL